MQNVTLENLENFFEDCDKLRLDLEHYLYEEEKNLIHSYDNDRNINELKNSLIKFYDFLTEKDKKNIIEIISKYREAVTYNFISLLKICFLLSTPIIIPSSSFPCICIIGEKTFA